VTLPSVKTSYTERSEPDEDTAEEARNRGRDGGQDPGRWPPKLGLFSRAAQRVGDDPELMRAATTIMEQLKGKVKPR